MSDPWVLASASGDNEVIGGLDLAPSYYSWVATNLSRVNGGLCLCNWFPLTVLVEFAAEKGFRVRLDYWPGSAPTDGDRFWDTSEKLIFDSHSGKFASKTEYLSTVQNKVTARMIGSLNSVAITQGQAKVGDLISHDHSDSYWHVEVISSVTGGITAQSGNVPKAVPRDHQRKYENIADVNSVYQGKPRRWEFEEILSS